MKYIMTTAVVLAAIVLALVLATDDVRADGASDLDCPASVKFERTIFPVNSELPPAWKGGGWSGATKNVTIPLKAAFMDPKSINELKCQYDDLWIARKVPGTRCGVNKTHTGFYCIKDGALAPK